MGQASATGYPERNEDSEMDAVLMLQPCRIHRPHPSARPKDITMNNASWSDKEKKIARAAFDKALQREFAALLEEFASRSQQIQSSGDLWDIEDFLRERRREIDRTYDYRYSQLFFVFCTLIRRGRLTLEDLTGLRPDKLEAIEQFVNFRVPAEEEEERSL